MDAHNCTNPPHFPPHCGCPAGAVINTDFIARVVLSDERPCDVPVGCDLSYKPETDPATVALTIQAGPDHPVVWEMGREFLSEGYVSRRTYGEGDIKLKWYPQRGVLGVCLSSRDGHAHIVMPHQAVAEFVRQMDERLPIDDINTAPLVDYAIANILNQK